MAEDKSQRAEDSIVSEMIKLLPQEKNEEIRRCFQDRFMVLKETPSLWNMVKLVILRKPGAALLRGDPKLQSSCADVSDVEVVCDVYYPSHGKSKRA